MYVNALPFGLRTTSATKEVTIWEKFTAAHFVVDHPNIGGGITVSVFGKDPASGFKYLLLSSNIVASGHTVMKIGPDYTAAANIAKEYIPYQISVDVAASGNNFFSVAASIM